VSSDNFASQNYYVMKTSCILLFLSMFCVCADAQKEAIVGTLSDTTYLNLKGLDNTDALLLDNNRLRLRHHYDMLVSDRDFMRIILDADDNQDNAEFAIYKDTFQSGNTTPVVRFSLDGFNSWINSGNLGIGDIAPSERLSVNGAIKIGNNNFNTPGVIRYFNNTFQGYAYGAWQSLMQDGDSNTLNEIQNLSLLGNNLKILGGNSVDLPFHTTYDTDNDTYVNTEFGTDDDKITIGLAGQQRMLIAKTGLSDRTYLSFPNNNNNILIGASATNIAATGTNNIYLGGTTATFNASGSENVMIGRGTGSLGNGQDNNVFVGNGVAGANTGDENVVLGNLAGGGASFNQSVILGYNAGVMNSGNGNIMIGYEAGKNSTDGFNIFIGRQSGIGSLGTQTVCIGHGAGVEIGEAYGNTFIGHECGRFNTSGERNTYVGLESGYFATTGDDNTTIGYIAGLASGAEVQCSSIGAIATATASFQIRVGSNSITSIGGSEPWTVISDGRYKSRVIEDVPGLEFINRLRPVTYHLDASALDASLGRDESIMIPQSHIDGLLAKEQKVYTGFIAQEVEAAAESLNYTFSGVDEPKNENDYYGLRYAMFTVPLVKAVQELTAQNTFLNDVVSALKSENADLKAQLTERLEAMEERMRQLENQPR
jgi:hypothetical protein